MVNPLKWPWGKIFSAVGWIYGLVGTIAAVVSCSDSHAARIEAENQKTRANQAEQQNANLQRRLLETQGRRDSIAAFAEDYQQHLSGLRISLSKYKEEKELGQEREQAAMQKVIASATALVHFVTSWKAVNLAQAALLDGNVTNLDNGRIASDIGQIQKSYDILEKEYGDRIKGLIAAADQLSSQK